MVDMCSCEIMVLQPAEQVVAGLPRTLTVGGTRFELDAGGRPQPVTQRRTATRFGGRWQRRWRRGRWQVDVLAVGRSQTLIDVTTRGRAGVTAADVARALRAAASPQHTAAADADPTGPAPRVVPVWKTASP